MIEKYNREKYKGYNFYYYDKKFYEIGKKIIDKNYKDECILKNTKRNFVKIINVDNKRFVFKENRSEYLIPQRKFFTFFKKGEALTTLVNLYEIIKSKKIDNFVMPFLAINKRKNGFINYSVLIMEEVKGKEDRSYLPKIVKLMERIHSYGIYHGDFNPSNFLVENGKIRILDTQGKKMGFSNYRAHYDMLTMKIDSFQEMDYPYKKNIFYYIALFIKKFKKLKFVEKIKKKRKKIRENKLRG